MSLPRFFLDQQVLGLEERAAFPLDLSAADSKHARVLRIAPGEHIAVIDAQNDYFECQVVEVGAQMLVRICSHSDVRPQRPRVILAQGLCKGEKMDLVIRHATELGVAAFIPFSCARSIVKLDERRAKARAQRWVAIARSAAMQSGQWSIPDVGTPCSVDELAGKAADVACVLVCWEEASEGSIARSIESAVRDFDGPTADARVLVVVGPEGGLEKSEVDRLISSNVHARAVTLGESILRCETAGIVAPALAIYELGGLR